MPKFCNYGLSGGNIDSVDVAESILSGENTIQQQMRVEAALATAQAELGIIPKEAAEEINKKCDVSLLNEEEYIRQAKLTGHPMIPLIRTYSDICENGYGEYVHYGATSQDIADTALMLQLKQTYELVQNKTAQLRIILAEKAKKYRGLVMMGRTNDQHALPITLGFKMASWVDEIDRSLERLEAAKTRIFVGQFAGAVGTMATLEENGPAIQEKMMTALGLGIPKIAWYSARDRLAELTGLFCILDCTLGRMANEVYNAQRTELNELAEGYRPGKVGSSTMPHKRNPFVPAKVVAYAREARSIMIDSLTCMESTNERDCRALDVENVYIPRICTLTDAALDVSISLMTDLEVHEQAISNNLDILHGLVFTEALMMRLSKEFGRNTAHEMIYELAQRTISENTSFREMLLADPKISEKISAEELGKIMEPANYIGLSEYFVDKVVGAD